MAVQVSVFLENQPGQLERVTGVLAEAGVNIRAMTLAGGAGAWGVLSLLVDDPDHAVRALRSRNLPATTRRIAVVEMVSTSRMHMGPYSRRPNGRYS